MADNIQSSAVFQELIEVRLSLQGFAEDCKKLQQLYQERVIKPLSTIPGLDNLKGFFAQLQNIGQQLNTNIVQPIQNAGQQINAALNSTVQQLSQATTAINSLRHRQPQLPPE